MVKGTSRRVVVVRSPDPRYFEQAIFLLREETPEEGVSAQQVLRQAKEAADRYLRAGAPVRRRLRLLHWAGWPAFWAGAGAAALVCLLLRLVL